MGKVQDWSALLAANGTSTGTIKLRQSHMRSLATDVELITVAEMELVTWLEARSRILAPNSLKSMVTTFRGYFAWAHRTGVRDDNPAAWLKPVRVAPGIPRPIPERLLAQALAGADPITRFMLLLGAYAGLRRAEIAGVHADHVTDIGLIVLGKGGKHRVVPIHPLLVTELIALDGWAFPSPVRPGQHVSPDYVEDRMQAALPKPWTCHSLRHRFATASYRACKDIRVVQHLLGHSSVATTQVYVHVDEDALRAAVAAIA